MKGNGIWIVLAIIWGACIIGYSIEQSNLPETVKVQQHEAKLQKQAKKQAEAQERSQFINSLSEMTWLEIYQLPDLKRLDALTFYGSRIFVLLIFGSILLGGARYMFSRK